MIITNKAQQIMALDMRGSLGVSVNVGRLRMGFNYLGFDSQFCGIYSAKKTLKGKQLSRMVHYRPSNPRTTAQQDWRAIFAAGWVEYNTLTDEEKLLLSKKARKLRLGGPQLFLRRWLQAHTS